MLPTDDTDLATPYSAQDYIDVATGDNVYVDQLATGEYAIHQFKNYVGTADTATFKWEGKTDFSPSASTVFLQIYNHNTAVWDTIDSDNASPPDVNFIMEPTVTPLVDYKDGNLVTSCRVYQLSL